MRPDDTVLRERALAGELHRRSRPLPRAVRSHLLAIYGFARLVDDIGDEAGRSTAIGAARLARRRARACRRRAAARTIRVFVRLTPDAPRRCGLAARAVPPADRGQPPGPGRRPATPPSTTCSATARCRPTRSASSCCACSAPPRPSGSPSSDDVCTGLQVVEHLQDVGEDLARGRVYLPARGPRPLRLHRRRPRRRRRRRPRCGPLHALRGRHAPASCSLPAPPLAATLRGRVRLAVAGFVGRRPRRPRRHRARRRRRARRRVSTAPASARRCTVGVVLARGAGREAAA